MATVKIIHTADWHIGKLLHKYSLEEDLTLFLDWLHRVITERETDLLLVAGDIFDTPYPSSSSLALYYRFLTRLIGSKCRVVITGGNHDSPGVLDAPREILQFLDIRVVGGAPEQEGENLLFFGELDLAVAAVPFLRDAELRKSVSGQNQEDRARVIREGIRTHYQALADRHARGRKCALIGMGHLYVNGASTSESEREIHSVGGLAAFGTEHFPPGFDYMALGHIHKPQALRTEVRYSGSPVPLSFSERDDQKYVLEITFDDGRLAGVENLPVPGFRELKRFSGSLAEVSAALDRYNPDLPLEPLVELDVVEPSFDPQVSLQFEALLRKHDGASFRIIKPRLTFESRLREAADLFVTGTQIEDLTPREVFRKKLEEENLGEEVKEVLRNAFEELLAEIALP